VHSSLIIYARETLAPRLPSPLQMMVEERIVFESDESDHYRGYIPDVVVVQSGPAKGSAGYIAREGGETAVAEPMLIHYPAQPVAERYIEIRDPSTGGKVITTIEFLSPANKKPGEPQHAFLQKQRELEAGGVSLVEIDLVRGGEWVVAVPANAIRSEDRTDLKISILRGWIKGQARYYPIRLQQLLPKIDIPLRASDAPLGLDLQALLDLCYDRGRYGDMIDYQDEALPPLTGEERAWAEQLLRQAKKR
jgi:hypothetical protein